MSHHIHCPFLVFGILAASVIAVFSLFTVSPSQAGQPKEGPPSSSRALTGFYGAVSFGDGCNTGINPGGLIFYGGGNDSVTMSGGSIHSDSCLVGSGGVNVILNDGDIEYGTQSLCSGAGCSFTPTPIQTTALSDIVVNDFIDCSGLPAASSNGDGMISPGAYNGIIVDGSDVMVMEPGLYCFDDDFISTGGSIIGNGVTLYMRSGGVFISGNVDPVVFSAPQSLPDTPNDGYLGLLMVMSENNDGNISLIGNYGSVYTGTIYAGSPDSTIDLSGVVDTVFNLKPLRGAGEDGWFY